MRTVRVEKITLNIGVGAPGDALDHAMSLLTQIAGNKAVPTAAGPRTRIPTWGVRPRLKIATKVTVRGKKAEELLRRLLAARDNVLPPSAFDVHGNFSFGIPEYIDIPGVEYDPKIGIIGLEVAVTLQRPGFTIKRRRVVPRRIPQRHRISRDVCMEFVTHYFHLQVAEVGEA